MSVVRPGSPTPENNSDKVVVRVPMPGTATVSVAGSGMGPTGAQGVQGIQGHVGVQGLVGIQGPKGTQGVQGTQGLQGLQGSQGLQGVQGTQGIQGPIGDESVANVLYVSKSGSDDNDGKTLSTSFLTIKAAMTVATPNTTVFVKSGDYTEENPVTIPARVAMVGDSPRTTIIRPATPTSDVFYVNNGCYIEKIGFYGHLAPAAAISFNPDGSAGVITSSPYIQNCSSVTTTGTGVFIDGDKVLGNKSMVIGQVTMFNQGGKGIHIVNSGYSQVVSVYTICCDYGILVETGGFCSVGTSDCSFGNYGLAAKGTSPLLDLGTISSVDPFNKTAVINGLSFTPHVNDVITFDEGTEYYTIDTVTPAVDGTSTVTVLEALPETAANATTAQFYKRSFILASAHTFEYVGAGTSVSTSLPQLGGIPVESNNVVQENGGKVFYTGTDQKGNFRIGGDLFFNNATGTITGVTFDRSLFAVMTPYILAIEG